MKLQYEYDENLDIMTIEGVRYSGEFFRAFSPGGMARGTFFELERLSGGEPMIVIHQPPENWLKRAWWAFTR